MKRLYDIFKIIELVFFVGFLFTDMYYLLEYWDTTCDQPIQLWLSFNMVIWATVIFTSLIPVKKDQLHYANLVHIIGFIAYIGFIILGYYMFFATDDCRSTVPAIYALLLGHIIIETIDSALLFTFITYSIICICYKIYKERDYEDMNSYDITYDIA